MSSYVVQKNRYFYIGEKDKVTINCTLEHSPIEGYRIRCWYVPDNGEKEELCTFDDFDGSDVSEAFVDETMEILVHHYAPYAEKLYEMDAET